MGTQKCFRCPENCERCTSPDVGSCLLCIQPYLLEDGLCKTQCEKPGYFPDLAGEMCINKIEFPEIGPMFTVTTLVLLVLCGLVKVISSDTEILPLIIATVSIVETIAILFCVGMAVIFE